ncbi:MAG: DUF655 domain-containing protein [Candidatus Micrarchaeota archaeon]|nr:DUF655 domain-containing protein [Candidatus Micrarchaeota archaeon]
MEMEEYGWVIDFLPKGRANERVPEPVAQLVGEHYFTLLEVTIKPNFALSLGQRIYIGRDERPEVERIRKRIEHSELTATARSELPAVLNKIVRAKEAEFVGFFNKAGPLSIRLHQLELLHGIGKKHLSQILEAREAQPFSDFKDLQARVPLLPDPVQLLIARITEELEGRSNQYLFVRPPSKHEDERERR